MIICRTPLRASLFGGGTDFPFFYERYGGCVISAAINKYIYIYLRKLPPYFDYTDEIVYSKIEKINGDLNTISNPLIRVAMQRYDISHIRLTYDADLPARTGLATSSAFAVGLVQSFAAINGVYKNKKDIANEAIFLERKLLKEAGGIQDQIACSYGGFNFINFDKDGYTVNPLIINMDRKNKLFSNLLMFYTGMTRQSSEVQKSVDCSSSKVIDNLLLIRELTHKAREIIEDQSASIDGIGDLLNETWQAKRKLSRVVSNKFIDIIYNKAINAGAKGGKLLGAGSGGYLLFYVPDENKSNVRFALKNLIEVPIDIDFDGSRVVYYE